MSKIKKPVISYSQCWEDTELVLSALNISSNDIIFSICSGGCNTLALQSKSPNKIISIDVNPTQIYLLELKKTAITRLNYNELLELLGLRPSKNRIEIYYSISPFLSETCKKFWDANTDTLKKGIIHGGKFESYLSFFRKYILTVIHSKKDIEKLISITDKTYQSDYYKKVWNNFRWKLIFKIFFSKLIMKNRGRSKEMFQHNTTKSVGNIYYERCEKAFSKGIVHGNRYLEYILKGNYYTTIPYYLEKKNIETMLTQNNISLVISDILSFLNTQADNSISKFNLSDVFESMTTKKTNEIFHEISRVATNNARIIFWNNLVKRDVPTMLSPIFHSEDSLVENLKKQDKVFFYDHFKIYTVKK
jgi:S-adenosylmethionine:diacylglycerol 3-amino-3-carboxypropyl transferase